MASQIGKGYVPVTFDKAQIGRDLSRSIDEGTRSSEGKIGSTFKRLAGIAAGAFAGVQVFSFLKDSIAEGRESNKVAAQTAAVIKSTGGAAGLSAKQFGALADSISRKTGIDDEQIQSAENLLATFTNLTDRVGKGNDIFSQATKIAVDMGAALGGDASSNAIQLGKALNDPVKGISALTRVGVTFTDQQREQIKAMQAAGDLAGAQKVILAELNKEFGGSAEATATAGAKFGVFWGNIKEQLGKFIIPLLDRLATWAMDTLPTAFGRLQAIVGPIFASIVKNVKMFVATLRSGFTEDEGTPVEKWALRIRDAWKSVQPFIDWLKRNWKPVLLAAGAAFALITAPVTTVVAGLVLLYVRFKGVRDAVALAIEGVKGFVEFVRRDVIPVISTVVSSIVEQFGKLVGAVRERWDAISEAIGHVLVAIKFAVGAFLAPIWLAWKLFHDQILSVVKTVWDQIKGTVDVVIRVIRDVIDAVMALINGDWGKAWDAIKDIPLAALGFVRDTIGNILDVIGEVLSAAWETFKLAASTTFDAVVDFFKKLPGRIVSAIGNLATTLLKAGADLVGGFIKGIKNAFTDVVGGALFGSIQPVRPDYNFYLEHPELPNPYLTGGGGSTKRLAAGGRFSAGKPFIAGEMGRTELILPDTSGLVVNHDQYASAMKALTAGWSAPAARSGPAMVIEQAHFHDEADIETLQRKTEFAVMAGSLG